MPVELDRLNWGVVLMPGIWSLAHGMWLWLLAEFGLWYLWLVLLSVLKNPFGHRVSAPAFALAVVVYQLAAWSLAIWFGFRGNSRVWRRESVRLARGRSPRQVGRFVRAQRAWAWVGVAWLATGVGGLLWMARENPAKLVGGTAGATVDLMATVIGLTVVWQLEKRRRAKPPVVDATHA